MTEQRFINEVEVSERTQIPLNTLRNWRYQRRGPKYRKIGRLVRYSILDLNSFMNENVVETELG